MSNIKVISQHSLSSAQAQAPFLTHDKFKSTNKYRWIRLSNGCLVSQFITVGELLEMVGLEETKHVIASFTGL